MPPSRAKQLSAVDRRLGDTAPGKDEIEVCPLCIGRGRRHCSSVPLKQLSSIS